MSSRKMLWFIASGILPFAAFGENLPITAPVPGDPLELVTGQAEAAGTQASRAAALQLLARARASYALTSTGQGYDLKVGFTVDSQGQTNYDGAWQMEDQYASGQGLHWTASTTAGYTITGISAKGGIYEEGTANAIPLRLQEARGALLDPIASAAYANRAAIRTATANFRGAALTCVLLSPSRNAVAPALGRGWEESEDCIDPESGLLQLHSQVPGRYAVYEYTNAPRLGNRTLARRVTITEAGRVVSKISVESLKTASPDPGLFVPTDAMKARGRAPAMTASTKIARVHGAGAMTSAMTVQPVCVFGVVTATGQLVEAHSLQPSDPNSQAAVEDAEQIDFSPSVTAGARPQQHFVFVIEKFVTSQ